MPALRETSNELLLAFRGAGHPAMYCKWSSISSEIVPSLMPASSLLFSLASKGVIVGSIQMEISGAFPLSCSGTHTQ